MDNHKKSWLKEHADTITIIGFILAGLYWADGKFDKINERFVVIEKEVTAIKTVLIMKNIIPSELAKCEKEKQ